MSNLTDRRTAMLVLLILFLDLVGFTLIFPLVPEMLDFYMTGARAPGSIDAWLLPLSQAARDLLPADRQDDTTMIILLGGILASLYSVLQFATSPYWGKLSDRIGRRPVLLITSLGLAVSYALWFLSSSFTLFIISRVVGGLMSGNMSVASAAMADTTTPEGRTRAMGMVGAAFGLGFVIGPVIGGLTSLIDLSAGRAHSLLHPFSLAALTAFGLALLSAGCNILWLRETLTAERGHQHQWTTNPLGTVRRNLRDPDFIRVVVINLAYVVTFSAWEFTFSFFYKIDFGLAPEYIGLVFLYVGVVLVLGQGGLVRVLTRKMCSRSIALIGLLVMPLPLYLFAYTAPSVSLSLLALFPVAIGASLVNPALTGLASLSAPPDRQGLALGVMRSAGSLGRAVGPLLGAYLYWMLGIASAYLILAGILLALFLFSFTLSGRAESAPVTQGSAS